jgi:hypothetical protein
VASDRPTAGAGRPPRFRPMWADTAGMRPAPPRALFGTGGLEAPRTGYAGRLAGLEPWDHMRGAA